MKNIISKNALKHNPELKKAQPKKLSIKDFNHVIENTNAIKGGAAIVRGGNRDDIGH